MGGGGASHGKDEFRQVKGDWGDPKCQPQKGIVSYTISANRQNPLAGTFKAAVFNTFRRTRNQILYWAPPLCLAYQVMAWANERSRYLNSKEGKLRYPN